MSQHDLTIANQGFPAFRADLNDALQALGSNQSGTSAPSPTFANQLWYDTTNNILKQRNEDNDAWISIATLDQSTDTLIAIGGKTLPTGDIVGSSDSQTLTNKTINASQLVNNSVSLAKLESTAQFYGMKNRIINGAMVIDQRNAGASVTPANGAYTLDRFNTLMPVASKFTVAQSSTAPANFVKSMLVTSASAYTVGATEAFGIQQVIEGNNVADLGWGTANAKTVTLSFWVRSSLTGTFGGVIQNYGSDRSYPFSYTISAANTWEQKSITVAGDTTGTWATNNSGGIALIFSMGAGATKSGTAGVWGSTYYASATGATSVVGTNGATFYLTGVQLEVGASASSFDYRPYGTELALCQRYYEKSYVQGTKPGTATVSDLTFFIAISTTDISGAKWAVTKRSVPTCVVYDTSGTSGALDGAGGACTVNTTYVGETQMGIIGSSGLTKGSAYLGYWTASAEL